MRTPIHTRLHLLAAGAFAGAAVVWALGGSALPGGRWLAVHLLTVGVATNLLSGLMPYFAATVLHAPVDDAGGVARFALLNAGGVLLLTGLPAGSVAATALGATLLSSAVFLVWRTLRRARRAALPSRFTFVGRIYERACGAFLHGALLGALLGVGVVPGDWYVGVRLAHLHVNLLGWVGLPLLATLVTLGPTVLRVRMADGAAPRAARALPRAATGLTVAVVALAFSGAPQPVGRALTLLAAAGLAVYAWGVASVCLPVLAVWPRRVRSLAATLLASASVWFLVAVAADVVLIASDSWPLLEVVAPALLVGVLVQAILGSLLHLLPMALTAGGEQRAALRDRLSSLPPAVAAVLNASVGVLTLLLVAERALGWSAPARPAWVAVASVIALLGAAMAWASLRTTMVAGEAPRLPRSP